MCLTGNPRKNPIAAFVGGGTQYIFLCSLYFVQEEKSIQPHCPTEQHNRFAGDPNIFYQKYQIYTLIYQFAHFYLGSNAFDRTTDPIEQLDWNDYVSVLNTSDSVRNPTNLHIT